MAEAHDAHHIGIGIDVGMTYTGAAVYRLMNHGPELSDIPIKPYVGTSRFPSQVYVPRDTRLPIVVGQAALDQAAYDDDDRLGVLYSLFKLHLGTDWSDTVTGRRVTARSLTAELLKDVRNHILAFLDESDEVEEKVRYTFSCPGLWNEKAMSDFDGAIRDAGFPAGYSMLDEATATALRSARLLPAKTFLKPGQVILVCDLGGGTLDLATVTVSHSGAITATAGAGGATDIGMSNLDKALGLRLMKLAGLEVTKKVDAALDAYEVRGAALNAAWATIERLYSHAFRSELLRHGELEKRNVCSLWKQQNTFSARLPSGRPPDARHGAPVPRGPSVDFTRDEHVRPLVEQMKRAIRTAVSTYLAEIARADVPVTSLTHAVISGGGAALPEIEQTLQELLPVRKLLHIHPQQAPGMVQQGAAMYAYDPGIVHGARFHASYGILVSDPIKPTPRASPENWPTRPATQRGKKVLCYDKFQVIFPRHSRVPTEPAEYDFPSGSDNDREVVVDVLRGEGLKPTAHESIAHLTIPIPAGRPAGYMVKVVFTPLSNGRMKITGYDPGTRQSWDTEFGEFSELPSL